MRRDQIIYENRICNRQILEDKSYSVHNGLLETDWHSCIFTRDDWTYKCRHVMKAYFHNTTRINVTQPFMHVGQIK